MIQKYEIVKALNNLNDKVLIGCRGTVLIVYSEYPTSYEVEFVNEVNETLDVLTVGVDDIVLAQPI